MSNGPHTFDLADLLGGKERIEGMVLPGAEDAADDPVPPARPAARAPVALPTVAAPMSTRELLRSLKARRQIVRRTIADGKRAERELAQIDRLIEAANKTPAPVRAIRSVG